MTARRAAHGRRGPKAIPIENVIRPKREREPVVTTAESALSARQAAAAKRARRAARNREHVERGGGISR